MMSEEKKAQDLEFIDVEAGGPPSAEAPTNLKSPAQSKKEASEALCVQPWSIFARCRPAH